MRAVSFCKTCDFRLPYCVRTDRRFCQQRCRVWWYWHPGRKRFDFSPGGWGLPAHPGKGQPKTLGAALKALTEARKHAADLEAAARGMQFVDHQLRSNLAEVRAAAVTSRRELMKEIESLHDELEASRQERAQAEESEEAQELREQVALLTTRSEQSEAEAVELRSALERAGGELFELRTLHEQHAEEVRLLKSQAATTIALRDHLNRQHAEVTRSRDEARGQLERTARDAAAKQAALARASEELSELRTVHERHAVQHAEEVRTLKVRASLAAARGDDLSRQHVELVRSRNDIHAQLENTKREVSEKQDKLGRTDATLVELRRVHARAVEQHAHDVRVLQSQVKEQTARHEEANRSKNELIGQLTQAQTAAAETPRVLQRTSIALTEQRERAERAERDVAQREKELKQESRLFAAAEKAHREAHYVAESDLRSLQAEKVRRLAAEKRVEQLTRELEEAAEEKDVATHHDFVARLLGRRDSVLAAELLDVRVHREEAVTERDKLSARLLKLTAPDQYLELAAKAGYDLLTDSLVQVKHEEVIVEDRLGQWQEILDKTERARRLDPEQPIIEQARAAAVAFRWMYFNHPHNWQKDRRPRWIIVGFLLDEITEQYLRKIAYRRIERMKKTTQELIEEAA